MRARLFPTLALVAWAVLPPAAGAADGVGAWTSAEKADLRLLAATDTIASAQQTVRLGLHVRLEEGWKIYWRSPGTAGLPPAVAWDGSENLAGAEPLWPAPKRFELFGLQSFGYADEVVLPFEVRLAAPGEPAALRATVTYLACREICVPGEASLALDLAAGAGTPSAAAHLLNRFAGRVPAPAAAAAVGLSAEQGAHGLIVTARSPLPLTAPDLFVETGDVLDLPAPSVTLADGGHTARFQFARAALPPGTAVTLTLVDGPLAVEGRATVAASALGPAAILLTALLGGLILNLMPCVLPVLAMKVTGLASLAGQGRGLVRLKLAATGAGVVGSMLLLGVILALVQAAGGAVGWGVQFQQPLFLAFMAAVTALFAFNLWGLFTIATPSWAGGLAEAAPRRGLAGDLATGAFATLLATPCSAPFVGTAAAWALTRGPVEILAVFAALGLGLALPWLAFALVPRAAAWLPRPGLWMVRLRAMMGLLLAGTSMWLLSVLAAQVGGQAAGLVAAVLVAAGVLLALGRGRRVALPGAAVLAAAAVALPALTGAAPAPRAGIGEAAVLPFSVSDLAARARGGETVLVDITADWCVTCQVNKALVLNRGAVAERLRHDVRVMRGDWTRPDPAIAAYLAGHGRVGIPFNAVYGPAAPHGIALPELLTEASVLDALGRAGGRARAP